MLWREGLAGGYYNNIIIIYFIIIVGRWRARGGQVYFRWATCKKVGPIFLFSKNLIIFFEELLVCVCGYEVVYIMCGCSLNYTFTIQSWKCSFKNFFLSFLLNRFSKIKEIFFFKFSYFFIIFEKCLATTSAVSCSATA